MIWYWRFSSVLQVTYQRTDRAKYFSIRTQSNYAAFQKCRIILQKNYSEFMSISAHENIEEPWAHLRRGLTDCLAHNTLANQCDINLRIKLWLPKAQDTLASVAWRDWCRRASVSNGNWCWFAGNQFYLADPNLNYTFQFKGKWISSFFVTRVPK